MLTAVDLDGETKSGTKEIQDESRDGVLTAELEASESSAAQRIPENGLGVGLFMTQASSMSERGWRMALRRHRFPLEHVS
jgi:hypothetical protein